MVDNATKCSAADGATQIFDFCHGTPLMVRAVDFNALHAEVVELRKDAGRYRWLRSADHIADWDEAKIVRLYAGPDFDRLEGALLDAAVDAAMEKLSDVGAA